MMAKYIFWKEERFWVGFFEDYPDYMTQGESPEDLKDHLRDLYKDLTSGVIPGIRKKALLKVA